MRMSPDGPAGKDKPRPLRHLEHRAGGAALEAKTQGFARRSIAKKTERGYRSDWADFLELCEQQGGQALPADPETVALYYEGLEEDHRSRP
jgi:hypothetical protein